MKIWLWKHPLVSFNVQAALILSLVWALTYLLPMVAHIITTGSPYMEMPPERLPTAA